MKIKYLYSSFKKANELGLLSEYMFFLQLKAINVSFLKRGALINSLDRLCISDGSISNNVRKLVKAGLLVEYKDANDKIVGYQLISYRRAWNLLGFRFKCEGYVERYKFDFIELSNSLDKKSIKAHILALELSYNKYKQEYRIRNKTVARINYHEKTLKKVKSNKKRVKKEATLLRLKSLIETPNENSFTGELTGAIQNQISCQKVASILGYSSLTASVNLRKKAQSLSILSLKNEKRAIKRCTFSKYMTDFSNILDKTYWKKGVVYKKICNTYYTRNTEFSKFIASQVL